MFEVISWSRDAKVLMATIFFFFRKPSAFFF